MVVRFLLSLFMILPLYGAGDGWLSRLDTKVEVGLYQPILSGDIVNLVAPSTFKNDFAYHDAKASLFALSLRHDYDYIPNIKLSYFNMQDSKSATLSQTAKVADGTFSGAVSSKIDYQVFSLLLYKGFKLKGRKTSLFGRRFYSGDLEFDIGLNTQLFQWRFDVQNLSNLTQAPSWITVSEFIPLPYAGMKYYWYDYTVSVDVAALAFSRAKSTLYKASVDYLLVDNLYLSAGYLYEQFKVLEGSDTVNFTSSGLKVSFKYGF